MLQLKKLLSFYVLSVLFGIVVINSCSSIKKNRIYPCYRLKTAPILDGILENDKAWESIPSDTGFLTGFIKEFDMNYPPSQQTSFKIGYDSTNLYLAIYCVEPWVRYLKGNTENEKIFRKDDGIEIFLCPENADEYQQFIVNTTGSRWSGVGQNEQETSLTDWEAKAHIGNDSYTIELVIPFKKLNRTPVPNEVWTGNICRNIITINCPENRKTSWSPINVDFNEPESFGQIVFKNNSFTNEEAAEAESRLTKNTNEIFRLKKQKLEKFELKEKQLVQRYKKKVSVAKAGITGVTKGKVDLVSPPNVPNGEVWRYGLGFPMQISPTEVALLCNIRMEGSGNIDFEIGTDVIIFNDLNAINANDAIPISRYEKGYHPKKGNFIVRKGPILGGFVPISARLADGSNHPCAGTGFGMCWAISHKTDEKGRFNYLELLERYAMMFQFSYDGEKFRVIDKKRVDAKTLLPNWNLAGNFITNAIPDGQDLLYVMIARLDDVAVAGVTRWQFGSNGWHPVSFVPVTGRNVTWSEPSLIREADGNLLFSARSSDRAVPTIAFDIGVWRSTDNGKTWKQVIHEKNRRSRSPISVNRTADGTPYIAANIPPLRRTREVLCIWPIDESRTRLECRIIARDARSEFGPAPSGSWWRIDHPTSAIVRLADGEWHNVLSYRIADNGEIEGNAAPAPETGCYVEEVFSLGKAKAVWNFREK